MGIVSVRQSVALTVGGCWHEAAAYLLSLAASYAANEIDWRAAEDTAVTVALDSFAEAAAAGLELEAGERLAQAAPTAAESLAEFGAVSQDETAALMTLVANGAQEFDRYLAAEQACLLEGLVRAWARRGLPRLLEEYEVLEVEREGRWELAQVEGPSKRDEYGQFISNPQRLWFLSRPDALLRHRQTGDLVLQSFKTTGAWDKRKEKDAQRDVQGLTEGVEVEQRLGEWWRQLHEVKVEPAACPPNIQTYLLTCSALPRISAIRYEYILKGEREGGDSKNASRLSKELSARIGFACRVQQSSMCYLWQKDGMTAADTEVAHSFSWQNEMGDTKKLYYKNWNQRPVWEANGGIRAWVDMLDQNLVQPEAGKDVLASVMLPPMTVYRQDDDLLDVVEQLEAQETQVAQDVAAVAAAEDEGARRSELNRRFPQSRSACSWPGECAFVHVCFGGAEARRDPMGTGKYKVRVPNHPAEAGDDHS